MIEVRNILDFKDFIELIGMYKLELFDIFKSIRNLSIKDNLLIHPPPK